MKHVTPQLAAWLGGELAPAEAGRLEEHLAACADCRREAAARRAVWDDLAAAAVPPSRSSVWPAVRRRTTGAGGAWFFGGGAAARSGLAAAALACGLVVALLLPGPAVEVAVGDEDETGIWLDGGSWFDAESDASLEGLWLAVGEDAEVTS